MTAGAEKRRLGFLPACALVAGAAFAAVMVADRDHYLRHGRWTDVHLYYATPTEGGEFVERDGGRLALNPRIPSALESRLPANEIVALRKEAAPPWWRQSSQENWLDRLSAVERIDADSSLVLRVRVDVADMDLAERLGRAVADEVLQFSARLSFHRYAAKMEKQLREKKARGEVVTDEMRRAANMIVGMDIQRIRFADRFYPKATAGRALVWWRAGESAVSAALFAALVGTTTGLVFRRRAARDRAISP